MRAPAGRGRARPGRSGDPIGRSGALIDLLLTGDEAELDLRHRRVRATRSRRSTPRRSRPPTSSADGAAARSGSPATPTPRAQLVEDLDDLRRRGRRRPLPPQVRPTSTGPRSRAPRRWRSPARRPSTIPLARLEPADQPPDTPAGMRVAFAQAVRDEIEPPQAPARHLCPTTTCSARLADALLDDDAPARARMRQRWTLRAGRRVPGHRPRAVGGARPRLHRPRHDGADRRPQAGHLRLPRRRRRHLPAGRPHRADPADARRQPSHRRRPRRRPPCAARRGRARRPARSWSGRSRPTTRSRGSSGHRSPRPSGSGW